MNIYFACSITGGRELEETYRKMVAALLSQGHVIPTSHLAESEAMAGERALSPRDVYERDAEWVRNCDALVAEVSVPSHGVGYEIAYALAHGKPVLCIAESNRRVSKMITGNSALRFESYLDLADAMGKVGDFLQVFKSPSAS